MLALSLMTWLVMMVRLIGVKLLAVAIAITVAVAMSIDFFVVARAQGASALTLLKLLELFLANY
jgi:hypothetical protein